MQKPWLKRYPERVPAEIPVPDIRSLRELIEYSFREFADRPAFSNMGATLSFSDLDRLSMQFARYLQGTLGLTRGERIAIMLPNLLQYPVAICGAFRAGLVVVNVNPLYTARELRHQLSDSGARAIVILDNFASVLEDVIDDTSVDHVITTGLGDLLRWPRSAITNFGMKFVRRAVPGYSLPGNVRFRSALRKGKQGTLTPVELGFADIAFLQYTG